MTSGCYSSILGRSLAMAWPTCLQTAHVLPVLLELMQTSRERQGGGMKEEEDGGVN